MIKFCPKFIISFVNSLVIMTSFSRERMPLLFLNKLNFEVINNS